MGGMTSKMVEDMLSDKQVHTPKTKQVPFDPRSPSDNISRTPITRLDTPERGRDATPKDSRIVSVVDPRSPIVEVVRTPIVIEKKEVPRRPLSLKPSEMKLDSFLCGPSDDIPGENEQDPRSPTTKVPRTPLEDKVLELELKDDHSDVNDENRKADSNTQENTGKEVQENTLVKKLFTSEGQTEKQIRRPLGVIQNSNAAKTPRDILQAKHCRNVEDEYNKNIQCLLPDQEITVQSNTEFVEDI